MSDSGRFFLGIPSTIIFFQIHLIFQTHGFLDLNTEDVDDYSAPHLRPLKLGAPEPPAFTHPRSWAEMRDSALFVDKTAFIHDFYGGVKPRHWMIKGRRGTGRTMILDMLRRFVELDPNVKGTTMVAKRSHKNFHLFADPLPSTGLPPEIFKNKPFFRKHFGSYPVIYLDFKLAGRTYNEIALMRQLLIGPIRDAVHEHEYLLNSTEIDEEHKELLKKYLHPDPLAHEAVVRAYPPKTAILLLKKSIKDHTKLDPVCLVDNVDAPVQEVIFDPEQDSALALRKLDIVSGLIEAVSDKELNITVPEARRTMIVYSMLPYHESVIYTGQANSIPGFFEAEAKALADSCGYGHELMKIRDWYGGWGLKTHPQGDKYNPFSLVSFLTSQSKEYKPYWPEIGSLDTFRTVFAGNCYGEWFLECYRQCEFTSNQINFWAFMLPDMVVEIKKLQRIRSFSQCENSVAVYRFVDLLENLGYLKFAEYVVRRVEDGWPITNASFAFRVPNLEIKSYMSRLFYDAMVDEAPINGDPKFRMELMETIFNIDGSERAMRRFAHALAKLFVAFEGGLKPVNRLVAHSVRVHLLHPPAPEFEVRYVKTGRTADEFKRNRNNTDLAFVVRKMAAVLGFVVRIDSVKDVSNMTRSLSEDYLDVFRHGVLREETDRATVKVVANLSCDGHLCRLNYLFNSTRLQDQKYLQVEKHYR
ncbi:uncharacterized protein [Bemisia tabaci]|uniref:uncharacterized protein isoform X1 n=1 Tax=Bemisia tabaci TaxID=7038 RepID=UPI003B283A49